MTGERDSGQSLPEHEDLPRPASSRRRVLLGLGAATGLSSGAATVDDPIRSTQTQSESPWSQHQKLTADDGDSGDFFSAVSFSADGGTALIGAWGDEDPHGLDAGSAYVFEQSNGEWTQQQKLTPDDGERGDWFGFVVSLASDGATALIGAPEKGDPNGEFAGSAYVFTRNGGDWTQQQKLTPDSGGSQNQFGVDLSLSGDGTTALIGADGMGLPNDDNDGAAYVFTRNDGGWIQEQKLIPDDGASYDVFGFRLSLSGDGTTALIGAITEQSPAQNPAFAWSVYAFTRNGGEWAQQQKLIPDGRNTQNPEITDMSVSDDGTTAFIGGFEKGGTNSDVSGSAYVFTRSGGEWIQQQNLILDDGDLENQFGLQMSLSGDGTTALIGIPDEEDPNGKRAGAAYVFSRSGGEWTHRQKLSSDDGGPQDHFGWSVSLSGDGTTALTGALGDEPAGADVGSVGSAYVFTRPTRSTPSPASGSGPGLGVVTGVSAVGVLGYLLRRRQSSRQE